MNIAASCIICAGKLIGLGDFLGSTSRADKLYPFTLYECGACGHVQKDVGARYKESMLSV
jgi:uncharacterized Zn finger protein